MWILDKGFLLQRGKTTSHFPSLLVQNSCHFKFLGPQGKD
jgi:hypothetical protein